MSTYNPDNVFRKILDGAIPCYKIFETDSCIAILDAFPVAPGHSLLIPKDNYVTTDEMPEDKAAQYLKEIPRLIRIVKAATGCNDVNVLNNNGPLSGQVVPHVHFHVIPRKEGDRAVSFGPSGSMIQKEAAEAILTKMTEAQAK
eukprot:gene2929-5734_t